MLSFYWNCFWEALMHLSDHFGGCSLCCCWAVQTYSVKSLHYLTSLVWMSTESWFFWSSAEFWIHKIQLNTNKILNSCHIISPYSKHMHYVSHSGFYSNSRKTMGSNFHHYFALCSHCSENITKHLSFKSFKIQASGFICSHSKQERKTQKSGMISSEHLYK